MAGGRLHIVDPNEYHRDLERMAIGEGEVVEIHILHAAEAHRAGQRRLWFACIRELSEHTGYDVKEMHELAKAAVVEPDWPTSLAEWSKDQLSAAISGLLRWSAETIGLVIDAA